MPETLYEANVNDKDANFGQAGFEVVIDTLDHPGEWYVLQCVDDTSFDDLSGRGVVLPEGHSTIIYPSGWQFFGAFTNFKLSIGKVVAYRERAYL
jgi:hypothetical protein